MARGKSWNRPIPAEIGSPFLTRVSLREDRVTLGEHPFDLPILASGLDLRFTAPVTYLVGENGSGKSTLLEALAWSAGFPAEGGARTNQFSDEDEGSVLGRALSLVWRQKVGNGFFLRAETFFNFATYLESVGSTFQAYGGLSLHDQSHGEAFLALFTHRFRQGLFILDEPEAALSPQRQLAFLRILYELATSKEAQFIIATHSPILLPLPGAAVWSLDDDRITEVDYRETDHFRVTRDFLTSPEQFFRYLLSDGDDEG